MFKVKYLMNPPLNYYTHHAYRLGIMLGSDKDYWPVVLNTFIDLEFDNSFIIGFDDIYYNNNILLTFDVFPPVVNVISNIGTAIIKGYVDNNHGVMFEVDEYNLEECPGYGTYYHCDQCLAIDYKNDKLVCVFRAKDTNYYIVEIREIDCLEWIRNKAFTAIALPENNIIHKINPIVIRDKLSAYLYSSNSNKGIQSLHTFRNGIEQIPNEYFHKYVNEMIWEWIRLHLFQWLLK